MCVCVCMVCGNLQGSGSDSGWDLCVDGPPVIKVVMAVLNQRTARRTEGGRTLGMTSGRAGSGTSCYLHPPAHGTALPQDDVS